MSRLAEHPLSNKIKDFLMKFRYQLVNQAALAEIPKVTIISLVNDVLSYINSNYYSIA